MKAVECSRQGESLELVLSAQWPDGASAELADHVARCEACGEVAAVAGAIRADLAATSKAVRVPPSGVMFWRAQRRAARESVRTAHRRSVAAQTVSVAAGVVVGIAGLRSAADWTDWAGMVDSVTAFVTPLHVSLPIAIVLTLCLTAAPIALILALRED